MKDEQELKPCPACGALPCDWTDNPFSTPSRTEAEVVAEIVAWLRKSVTELDPIPSFQPPLGAAINRYADAIQSGAYRKQESGDGQ